MNGFICKLTKNIYSKILLLLVFTLLLEVFVFNFRFFATLGYEPLVISGISTGDGVESRGNSKFFFNKNDAEIYIDNIGTHIHNMYLDVEETSQLSQRPNDNEIKDYKSSRLIKAKIKIDDYSRANGIEMPERNIVSTVEKTKYIPFHLKGETNEISIKFNNVENKEVAINNIILNANVPFFFSITRVFVILLITALVYIIRPNSKFYKYLLNLKSKKQKALICVVVALQTVLMITTAHINPMYVHNTVSWQNQYNELADAILEGRYYLDITTDPTLAQLENPYDPDARNMAGASAQWDHAYHEGKYYVYFGILPSLLVNLPIKALTNIEVKPIFNICLTIPFFVVMSWFLIYAIFRKFNKEGGSLLVYMMLSTLFVTGVGTAFVMVWPDMYTVPIFTALTLSISGLFCWLTAFKKDDTLSVPKLLAGSLLLALTSATRPQMLLTIFIAIPLFYNTVFKERRLFSKESIPQTLAFVLPVVMVALFMMHYNFARFGSPFDFGANYNLTTNDMTSRGISLARIPQGIFAYILQPLNIKGVFPYITSASFATNYMGITIKEGIYGGVIFIQPLILMLVLLPKVKLQLKEKGLWSFTIVLSVFAVVIACADSIMAGLLARYYTDFMWMFVLSAIVVCLATIEKYKDSEFIKVLKVFLPCVFMFSLVMTFLIVTGAEYYGISGTNPELYNRISTAIQFWL